MTAIRNMCDIIRRTPITLPPTATVQQACQAMHQHRVGAIVVVDEHHRLLGIFTGRDAVRLLAEGRNPSHTHLEMVMTRNPLHLPPGHDAVEALQLMHDGGFRHVPVVDKGSWSAWSRTAISTISTTPGSTRKPGSGSGCSARRAVKVLPPSPRPSPPASGGEGEDHGRTMGGRRSGRCCPSVCSMRINWLYFAVRSLRARLPVLIWPQLVATARSAMVASSVSPERWLITTREAGAVRHFHRLQRLGQGADLVDLHQDGVADALLDAAAPGARGW